MRLARVSVLAVLVLVVVGASNRVPESPSRLKWLAGCWRATTPRHTIDEQWMAPSGDMLLGMSRGTRRIAGRDTVVEYEFMRIFARGDSVIFRAHPKGQAGGEFPAERMDDSSVVFANPAHDFPQRILYRISGDSLHASIEGQHHGKPLTVPFPFARVACVEKPASR